MTEVIDMSKKVKLRPITQREEQIVNTIGDDGWIVMDSKSSVQCLNFGPGILIKKHNIVKWVKPSQIEENDA